MEIDGDKLFELQEALIELSAENIELKKSATGPWNYDDPPPGDKVIIAIYNSKYLIKPIFFFGIRDFEVEKGTSVICWAYVNMPEGR